MSAHKSRFKLIPEVHLVLRRNDQFLMLRRFQTGYMDGKYSLVAGHVDGNETFRSAMVREAYEEAGIVISSEKIQHVHTMHRLAESERLSMFFEATHWEGEIKNMEPEKCDDLGWYTLAEQEGRVVPYVKSALTNVVKRISYSEFGW